MPGWPCEACQTVHFDIKNSLGENIGLLEKRSKNCCAAMLSDADNFTCEFPNDVQAPEHRSLLMATVLFIDYMMFED